MTVHTKLTTDSEHRHHIITWGYLGFNGHR